MHVGRVACSLLLVFTKDLVLDMSFNVDWQLGKSSGDHNECKCWNGWRMLCDICQEVAPVPQLLIRYSLLAIQEECFRVALQQLFVSTAPAPCVKWCKRKVGAC